MTASRIALDAGALTILPLVMIAQSLQFRRDRMFEVGSKSPSRQELRTAVMVSLVISITAYLAMAVGWAACVVELQRGRSSSLTETLILVGFGASFIALTRGGILALAMAHFERRDQVQRDLEAPGAAEAGTD